MFMFLFQVTTCSLNLRRSCPIDTPFQVPDTTFLCSKISMFLSLDATYPGPRNFRKWSCSHTLHVPVHRYSPPVLHVPLLRYFTCSGSQIPPPVLHVPLLRYYTCSCSQNLDISFPDNMCSCSRYLLQYSCSHIPHVLRYSTSLFLHVPRYYIIVLLDTTRPAPNYFKLLFP